MKAKMFTLLDIQKAIVLAQRPGTTTVDSPVIVSKIVRSKILQQVTNVFVEKYGETTVTEDCAIRVIKDAITRFVNGCGVNDKNYISQFSDLFIRQLKEEVVDYVCYLQISA